MPSLIIPLRSFATINYIHLILIQASFQIRFNWWSFTWVWMTACLQESSGYFSESNQCVVCTVMFHILFRSLARYKYLYIFKLSFIFRRWSPKRENPPDDQLLSFFKSHLAWIWWFACFWNSQRIIGILFSSTDFFFYSYTFCSRVKFYSLAQFPLDHLSYSVAPNSVFFWH